MSIDHHPNIDITFDFTTDTPPGRDPDQLSPTLRRYHKLLWSKPLPNGANFILSDLTRNVYLQHRSHLGEFFLSSDSFIPTYLRWVSMRAITDQLTDAEKQTFWVLGYTIGGMIIFPSNRVEGRQTLNGARGFNRKIADRMDLTLECIRRFYRGEDSPLARTLRDYQAFFQLFTDFRGYVDFFLLQDLVTSDYTAIKFYLPFADFSTAGVPPDIESYRLYRERSMQFIRARNQRIAQMYNPTG